MASGQPLEPVDGGRKRRLWSIGLHLTIAALLAVIMATAIAWMLWRSIGAPSIVLADPSGFDLRDKLELIKISLASAAGVGGLVALVVAYRKQRIAEAAHEREDRVAIENRTHAERLAASSELDLSERRVTELYTKAADQLGSSKAPVRLAGTHRRPRGVISVGGSSNYGEHGSCLPDRRWRADLA